MKKPAISAALQQVAHTLHQHGFQCYLVGGAVRSHLLHIDVKDFDLATDATPDEVIGLFKRVIPTGIKHGTVTILQGKEQFEITTFRTDGKYSDGRRPDTIQFIPNILEDLKRRDFTINSIAYNLVSEEFYDPNRGQHDLENKIIRAIGDPMARFSEDGLRPLRALRFVAQLGFNLDESTYEAITQTLFVTAQVSRERISEEMLKLCMGAHAARALFLMRDCGLMEILFPELYACHGTKGGDLHQFDVLTHQIYALEGVPLNKPYARIAALFHDIGKPVTQNMQHGKLCYHGHEEVGAEMVRKLGRQYHMPIAKIEHVAHLVAHHMFQYSSEWSNAAIRRFIARVGYEYLDDLFALREADVYALERRHADAKGLDELKSRIRELYSAETVLSIAKLAVNGSDLLAMGLIKGPKIGAVLKKLLDCVLDDPAINSRDQLLNLAALCIKEETKS